MTAAKTLTYIVAAFTLIIAFLFLAIAFEGNNVQLYSSSNQIYQNTYPNWTAQGELNNVTVNSQNELTIDSDQPDGTYTYVSDVINPADRVNLDSFTSELETRSGEATIIFYTSENNFSSVERTESIDLMDGRIRQTIDLGSAEYYRFQIFLTKSGNQDPVISSLQLEGREVIVSQDYSRPLYIMIMLILLSVIIITSVKILS